MKVRTDKRMPPEEAMEILKQEGIELTLEQAQLVLDFLYKVAKISLAIIVENPKSEWYRQFDSYKDIMEEMGFQIELESQFWPETYTGYAFQKKSIISISADEMRVEKVLSNSLKCNFNKGFRQ